MLFSFLRYLSVADQPLTLQIISPFSFAHVLHISEARSTLGWGKDVTRKRIQAKGFFFRTQRGTGDPNG